MFPSKSHTPHHHHHHHHQHHQHPNDATTTTTTTPNPNNNNNSKHHHHPSSTTATTRKKKHPKHPPKPPRPKPRPRLFPTPSVYVPPLPPQSQSPQYQHSYPYPAMPQPQRQPSSARSAPLQPQWSPELRSLEEILKVHPLPLLVQCRSHVVRRSASEAPFPIPLEDRPLLLADRRTARHILARIVVSDAGSRTFSESTDTVVIPEDYEGNFLRLHSRTTKDKSHVQSLDDVAHDDTPAFLNLSNLTSFPAGSRDQSKFIYTIGNVFLVDEPPPPDTVDRATGETRTHESSGGSGGGGGGGRGPRNHRHTSGSSGGSGVNSSGSNGLMRCLDERGVALLVPTDQEGEVVAIQKRSDERPVLSLKSREIISAGSVQFPVLARYAYSKRPPRLTAFSKLLTMLDAFEETSVIGCVIDGINLTLLEFPVTSSLQFQPALNSTQLLQKVPRMRIALNVCRTRGKELSRDLKYKLKFAHRMQETVRQASVEGDEEGGGGGGGGIGRNTTRTRLVLSETYVYI